MAKTKHFQLSYIGYAVFRQLTVPMPEGIKKAIVAGESYMIPPGHDAWVEGGQPFVGIEVMSADVYAKS